MQTVAVRNDGNADLAVAQITLEGARPGDFSLSGLPGLPVTLAPGSSFTFGVGFRPSAAETNAAEVVIASDDPDENPVRVGLTGSGVRGDTEPPRLICPPDLVVWTGGNEARVDYSVTADDDCDSRVTVACEPPSGSLFPVGDTRVTCTAADASGKTNQCAFLVQVRRDTEAPQIACPTDRVVSCVGAGATPVFFNVTATDNSGGIVFFECTPASGASFPLGQTLVTCTATDAYGNASRCSFPVTVREAGAPTLSVQSEGNTVLITWPMTCAAYTFETTTDLNPPAAWAAAGTTPTATARGYVVSVQPTNATRFYRLKREN
jgi:hypothetical protein